MQVKLQNDWFVVGNLVAKGEQTIDDELFPQLPKTAQVWDGEKWVPKAEFKPTKAALKASSKDDSNRPPTSPIAPQEPVSSPAKPL